MNGLKKAWYRSFQFLVNIGGRFLYWRKPIPITGAGSTGRIPELLRDNRVTKVMVVTGRHVGRELAPAIIENIQSAGISCVHFSGVEANPSTTTVFKPPSLPRRKPIISTPLWTSAWCPATPCWTRR